MKKLLIIPLIVLSSTLFAQKFQFGLKGGLNVSNFTNASFNNVDNKAIVGVHGGALLSHPTRSADLYTGRKAGI
jgi:hypothetical protein